MCSFLGYAIGGIPQLGINEIDVSSPGAQYAEFIEIKNRGPSSVNLEGYQIYIYAYDDLSSVFYVIDNQTLVDFVVNAGEYYVVCAVPGLVPLCTQELRFSNMGNLILLDWLPDVAGVIVLEDPLGYVVDIVGYDQFEPYIPGYATGDPTSVGDIPDEEGYAIARVPDGVESFNNSVDFAIRCPSPGRPNSAVEDTPCSTGSQSDMMINEIDYTQPGQDDREFIEIHNRANAVQDFTLAAPYSIDIINNNNVTVHRIALSTIAFPFNLEFKGYWALCAAGCSGSGLRTIGTGPAQLPSAINWLPNPEDSGGPVWTVRLFRAGSTPPTHCQ